MPRTAKLLFALLVLAALAGFAPRAHAANCSVSATPVAFGTYSPVSPTPLDGQGSVIVDCNGNGNQASVSIKLDAGLWGTYASRAMAQGADRLFYNLYTDPGRNTVFANGTTVSCTTGVTNLPCVGSDPSGNTLRATRPIYGRMPTGQDVASGNYSDTVTVTITF